MNTSQGFGFEANNGSISVPDLQSAINIIEEKERKIANLEALILFNSEAFNRQEKRLRDAKMHLEVYLDDDNVEVEEGTDLEALCNVLQIERTQSIDIKVTATWYVSAIIPRNYDPQEWADELGWDAELNEDVGEFDTVSPVTIEAEAY